MTTSGDGKSRRPVPLSQRRVDPAAGKWACLVWLQDNLSDIARGAAAILMFAILACIVIAVVWHWETLKQQSLKTPLLQGTAVVIDKQVQYNFRKPDRSAFLSLRIDGAVVRVYVTDEKTEKWEQTFIGQTVTVSYHAGAGVYVVDDWQPPPTKAAIRSRLQASKPNR